MKILVLGASGATGKLLVERLLQRGRHVRAIVRPSATIPDAWHGHSHLTVVRAAIAGMRVEDLCKHVADCEAIACCLGHGTTLAGVFGKPRTLVADAVALACRAVERIAPQRQVRFVLMNAAGCRNNDLDEPLSGKQRLAIGLIRALVPPHADNEKAAEFLRAGIGQLHAHIGWVVVRPDNLTHEACATPYTLSESPLTDLFNPYKTSRANVAHFIARLLVDMDCWNAWKGRMPVIYDE